MSTYIDTTSAANHIPEVWVQEAYGYFQDKVIMPKLVRTQFGGVAQRAGFDKVNVPKRGSLTVRSKSINTDVTLDDPSDSVVTITVDQHKYIALGEEDSAATQTNQDVALGYIRDGAAQLADQVDKDILTLANNFTQAVGDFTSAITLTEFLEARRKLLKKKPPGDVKSFIFTHHVEEDLLQIAQFADADKRGDAAAAAIKLEGKMPGGLARAWIGRWFGVDLYASGNIEVDGAGTDQENNLLFTPDAIGFVMQEIRSGTSAGVERAIVTDPESGVSIRVQRQYDLGGLGEKIVLDALYGFAELNDDFGVWVKTQQA